MTSKLAPVTSMKRNVQPRRMVSTVTLTKLADGNRMSIVVRSVKRILSLRSTTRTRDLPATTLSQILGVRDRARAIAVTAKRASTSTSHRQLRTKVAQRVPCLQLATMANTRVHTYTTCLPAKGQPYRSTFALRSFRRITRTRPEWITRTIDAI